MEEIGSVAHNPGLQSTTLQRRHDDHDVSNHRQLDCLLNLLFRRRSGGGGGGGGGELTGDRRIPRTKDQ